MGEIIMRNWDLREFCLWVNWPSPIREVRVLIRRVITLIPGLLNPMRPLLNPIRLVVLLISYSRLYPPYRSHLHPPSLSFVSTTLPSLQEHKVKSSLSISPCHHHELTLSAAYTEYSIHLRLSVVPSFSRCRVDPWMLLIESQHLARLPSTASRSTTSKYTSNLARS